MTRIKNSKETLPGVKDSIDLSSFTPSEKQIIHFLGRKYWYVTRAECLKIAKNSTARVAFIKPTTAITRSFNLSREVIVIFSSYSELEPRTIDAIDSIDLQGLRTEEICSIIISGDPNVDKTISSFIRTSQESRIFVPFQYEELKEHLEDDEYVVNKFRKYFYSRNLFAIQDPLKKELYFFGRNEFVQELVNKHLCGENAGIFGLRKTGKTSILYGIKRTLDKKNSIAVVVDCETLHLKSWNIALQSVIDQAKQVSGVKKTHLNDPVKYENEMYAGDAFKEDIQNIYYNNGRKSLLLIFDEIENISYGTSISPGWKSGRDFIKFWQVIRSAFQMIDKHNVFTYLIAGTNPSCIEKPTIDGTDNPLFSQFTPMYIPPFDYNMTHEMVSQLGGFMGMSFSNEVCAHLVEDFGGHPMMIRQMCSYLHLHLNSARPVTVTTSEYREYKDKYYKEENGLRKYAEMVLEVLDRWYKDEYSMLQFLALGDEKQFEEFAHLSPEYTSHLIKYGIISYSKSIDKYHISIEAIRDYLQEKNRYKKVNLTMKDKQQEISMRRNSIEPKLRDLVRRQLKASIGEEKAKEEVIKQLYGADSLSKYITESYKDLFNANKHNKWYLSTLFKLILANYNCFVNIFDVNKDIFKAKTDLINYHRKPDAHATDISDNEFNEFRGSMGWLEDRINEYD